MFCVCWLCLGIIWSKSNHINKRYCHHVFVLATNCDWWIIIDYLSSNRSLNLSKFTLALFSLSLWIIDMFTRSQSHQNYNSKSNSSKCSLFKLEVTAVCLCTEEKWPVLTFVLRPSSWKIFHFIYAGTVACLRRRKAPDRLASAFENMFWEACEWSILAGWRQRLSYCQCQLLSASLLGFTCYCRLLRTGHLIDQQVLKLLRGETRSLGWTPDNRYPAEWVDTEPTPTLDYTGQRTEK